VERIVRAMPDVAAPTRLSCLCQVQQGVVMGLPQRAGTMTSTEYLRRERSSDGRHEYFRGEVFAMAGGSLRHSQITTNVLGELRNQLKGQDCAPQNGDLRIKCPTGLYTYPDTSVICGAAEFDDELRDTVLNPVVIIEVLSKSTEAYDRGKKFEHYRTIPSLREYVLISQEEPLVQRFLRNENDSWTLLPSVSELSSSVALRSIGIELPLSEIYDRVDFSTAEAEMKLAE
jgi:Uma2 family endonuclease